MVECLTRDRGVVGPRLTRHCVVSLSKTRPSLELVIPRKTRSDMTEKLLTGV